MRISDLNDLQGWCQLWIENIQNARVQVRSGGILTSAGKKFLAGQDLMSEWVKRQNLCAKTIQIKNEAMEKTEWACKQNEFIVDLPNGLDEVVPVTRDRWNVESQLERLKQPMFRGRQYVSNRALIIALFQKQRKDVAQYLTTMQLTCDVSNPFKDCDLVKNPQNPWESKLLLLTLKGDEMKE